MAIVTSSIEINGPIEQVYALAKDVESFPGFMTGCKSVKVVESNGRTDRE